ncbi:fumarylacetoacetate hydrolase family protein [Candidatus Latescibacterota bacterium]
MRLIRCETADGRICFGEELESNRVQPMKGCMYGDYEPDGGAVAVKRLLAPVKPSNIICIGLNYLEHAEESGNEVPDIPVVFMKPTTAVTDPFAQIRIPKSADSRGEVDYEVEIAVVIGKRALNVSESHALDYVLGYTVANDVSARKIQLESPGTQWDRGKGFDTFCPLGPAIVTTDEIKNPQSLLLKTILNGTVMQDYSADRMIFSVAALISYLSTDTTLLPGTVILTGTPPGVGFARTPPVFLMPGDTIRVEVSSIGALINTVEKV